MLYIMRHGTTEWNKKHMLQGRTDVPLNDDGRLMAAEAAEIYKDIHFDVCYCSPLIRARETAEIFLKGRNIPIITDDRLMEMCFGIYEGTENYFKNSKSPVNIIFREPQSYKIPFEGAESFEMLYARTGEFIKEVVMPELEKGKLEYKRSLTTGKMELESAAAKLYAGQTMLEQGRQELENQSGAGLLEMKAAREQLAQGKYTAHVQLSEAQEKLDDAQKQLDALDSAKWIINDRDDNPGYSGLNDDAARIDNIARVFPLFFLLVAGLVCLTTMTRMVEERRTETGTLKALGYSNADIAKKYIIYSALAAVSGSIVGSFIGVLTLPYIIVDAYCIMYTFPPTTLVISWSNIVIASVAGIVCICSVSLGACFRDLKLSPATLMRPKAPKPGKRIFLEYITPVWKHLNFTSKVTARNLFRYKARFLMTVVGVAGCTALIIAAFGLRDSTTGIAPLQFKEVTIYDQVMALSKSGTANKKAYLMSQIHADDRLNTCR